MLLPWRGCAIAPVRNLLPPIRFKKFSDRAIRYGGIGLRFGLAPAVPQEHVSRARVYPIRQRQAKYWAIS